MAGLGGLKAFYETVKFHLRATEWRTVCWADGEPCLGNYRFLWSLSFHTGGIFRVERVKSMG